MTLEEYHANQRANGAQNQASSHMTELTLIRRELRQVERHVKNALAVLSAEADGTAWSELEQAANLLSRLR